MRRASLSSVQPGDVLGQSIVNERGQIMLTAGTALTDRYLRQLIDRGTHSIDLDDAESEGIEIPTILSETLRATATNTVYQVYEALNSVTDQFKRMSPLEIASNIRTDEFRQRVAQIVPIAAVISVVDEIMNEVMDVDLMTGMAAIKSYDNYTFAHSVEVATVALVVGRKLRLDRGSLKRLARACLLHDIGKVFVADTILNKPGPLDPEESRIMRTHTVLGFELLQATHPDDFLVNHVALQHHERQDGTGYPRQLTGTNKVTRPRFGNDGKILLIAEIAAVADVYDALASSRPYRSAMAPEDVLTLLRTMSGASLNTEVLDVFLSAVPVFPVGMTIRVTAGAFRGFMGVVARLNRARLDRPIVRIVRDCEDTRITSFEMDLSTEDQTVIESIL